MKVHASLGRGGKSQTLSYRTQGTGDPEDSIPERWFQLSEFPKVASSFDFILLGLRPGPTTRHIINSETLKHVKPTALLINPARGDLIDEPALVAALKNKQLG